MNVRLIYLAAGNSRRFGENKLFYEVDGKAMYRHLLERLVRIAARHEGWEVVVVSQYGEVLSGCEAWKTWGGQENLSGQELLLPVYCAESREGISHSIRAGILAGTKGIIPDAYVFFVADQPYLKEETAEAFLSEMEARNAPLGCVCHGEEMGNPVWFSARYRDELLALTGDTGGKKVLKAHPEALFRFPVEDLNELSDIDRKM